MTKDIKATAHKVCGKMKAMKESIEADEKKSTLYTQQVGFRPPKTATRIFLCYVPTGSSVLVIFQGWMAHMRIRKLQHSTLEQDFVELMTDYNKQEMDFHDRHKDHIRNGSTRAYRT